MKNKIVSALKQIITEVRIPFKMNIPSDILELSNIFKKYNYTLVIVGGAVRDAVLSKIPKDYDLVTDAHPDKVEEMMKAAGFKTLPTGKAFGVINVFTREGEYEIATMRADVGSGRRPDSVVFSDINTDAKRRDLTCNALFYDIDTQEIVDLVGGLDDIKNGIVRTVGIPEDRFGEDRLRILRAIRFAGRFGSDLDPATDAALQKDASLENISGERIRDEFLKGIQSAKDGIKFLQMIDKYGLFDWIFRGLSVNKKFINDKDYIIVLADMLKGNNLDTLGKTLNGLKYTDEEIKAIRFLIAMLKLTSETAVTLKKAQEHSGVTLEQIKNFCKREGVANDLLTAFLKFNLTVSGPEAMAKHNLKPSPELGKAIHSMELDNFKNLSIRP